MTLPAAVTAVKSAFALTAKPAYYEVEIDEIVTSGRLELELGPGYAVQLKGMGAKSCRFVVRWIGVAK